MSQEKQSSQRNPVTWSNHNKHIYKTTKTTTTTTPTSSTTNFMTYMNSVTKSLGNGGMTTQQAAALITQAAKDGLIKKEDQLNYMMIYG